jgi:hypothetical protein
MGSHNLFEILFEIFLAASLELVLRCFSVPLVDFYTFLDQSRFILLYIQHINKEQLMEGLILRTGTNIRSLKGQMLLIFLFVHAFRTDTKMESFSACVSLSVLSWLTMASAQECFGNETLNGIFATDDPSCCQNGRKPA